jgi:hypothetical protein
MRRVSLTRPAARSGFVALEALVVLLLSTIVGAALCATLIAQSRVARSIGDRIAFNDAARAAIHIVQAETRLNAVGDTRAWAPESINGRWTRASGSICATSSTSLWLRVSGIRDVDTGKDSILVLSGERERVVAAGTLARDATGCQASADETVYRVGAGAIGMSPADAAAFGGVATVFESGSYYLSTRALRYRVGGEGRQPLTEEFFRDGVSSFGLFNEATGGTQLRVVLAMKALPLQSIGPTTIITMQLVNTR